MGLSMRRALVLDWAFDNTRRSWCGDLWFYVPNQYYILSINGLRVVASPHTVERLQPLLLKTHRIL